MFHNLQFLRTLPLPSVRTILSLYLLIDLVPNCLPNEYLTEMSRTCHFESRAFIKHSWTTLLISVLIIFANQISKQYEHVVNSTVMTVFYLKGGCLKDNHLENSPLFFFCLTSSIRKGMRACIDQTVFFQQIRLQATSQLHEMEWLQIHVGGTAVGEQKYCTESGQRVSGTSNGVQKCSLGKNALLPSPNVLPGSNWCLMDFQSQQWGLCF